MRPWIISSGAAAAALAAIAAWLWLSLAPASAAVWVVALVVRAPVLALAFLSAYAALVLLATTAIMVIDLGRVRSRLARLEPPITRHAWVAAFAGTALVQLADRTLDLAAAAIAASPDTEFVLQTRFEPGAARREIAQLYWRWLAQAQFATALVLLMAILGIVFTSDYLQLPFAGTRLDGPIPLVAVLALVSLAACGRLAIAVPAESLLDALARVPVLRFATSLLRLLTDQTAAVATQSTGAAAADPPVPAIAPLLDRLAAALEVDREAQRAAIASLSGHCDALIEATHALSERLDAFHLASADAVGIGELPSTIARLAVAIEELGAQQIKTNEPGLPVAGEQPLLPRAPVPLDLRQELRRLVADLE